MKTRAFAAVPALLLAAALACSDSSSPSDGADFVSFKVDGQLHVFHPNTENVSVSVRGETFSLGASNLIEGLYLNLDLSGYTGPATYGLGTSPGHGRLVVGGIAYETIPPNGDGSLTISSAQCTTKTEYDPVTGITGPVTTCHVRGSFAFVGVSDTGATVAVTDGEFKATSVRGAG